MARAMDPLSRDIRAIKRVVVNRKMVDELHLAFADGLFEMARACVLDAEVPVAAAPHRRKGGRIEMPGALRDSAGAAAWADGRKIAEMPRKDGVRIRAPRGGGVRGGALIAVGGFGTHHAHLVEFGTVHAAPHPFYTPAIRRTIPEAESFIRLGVAKRAYVKDAVKGLKIARMPARSTPAAKLSPPERKARQLSRVVNALASR